MDRQVIKGQVYRHFKGNLYEIVGLARHTETEEQMVVYRPCNTDDNSDNWFVRPLGMFLSEVDHEKYPQVSAKYRFALVNSEEENQIEVGQETLLDEQLERLLDAKNYGEKAELLYSLKDRITKEMIRTICITHDIELNSTDIYDQYEELKSYMLTMEKYETNRLR